MIVVKRNKQGLPVVTIEDDGALSLGSPACRVKGDKGLSAYGFYDIYTRHCLGGGTVTRYERNDGLTLRRFVDGSREWWDTGENVCDLADIDAARKLRRQLSTPAGTAVPR